MIQRTTSRPPRTAPSRRKLRALAASAGLFVAAATTFGATPAIASDVTVTIPPVSTSAESTPANPEPSASTDSPNDDANGNTGNNGTSGNTGNSGNTAPSASPANGSLASTGVGDFARIALAGSGIALAAGGVLLLVRREREDG
jgi:hypothetical protein